MRHKPTTRPTIRPARPGEAQALSDLCLRSKAHWGYDHAFLEQCRAALTVPAAAIAAGEVFVAEGPEERALGVLMIGIAGADADVVLLFVEPAAIGQGVGRLLWRHGTAVARAAGCRRLRVVSDPYAVPFYRAMGAVDTGIVPSDSIPGRTLPVLTLDLAARE